ncbi:DUF3953 domain-containing protein [Bacillus sp. CH126_4D]|uniref:DUF3953 domain-containing protein n=1 Tax=unclassified Bacillus (in: firmicutes) TaxID=185979 RepID=UPI00124EEED6|nr:MULTISPECIES: DUF3953 domain-containing protein [unclassified Bacillus (in: firmicutes)]KAB2459860.1 DUF3953 domain-containing protein [Bacillus sp. CH140a_4T]KAB2469254.1 DUF3953 domain-containing protein [Bacillus sp. CH126_4D]
MNRILTILLAIIVIGYSIYSWDDASKQSVLILQTLLGCMLVSMGVQNLKNKEKENRSIGVAVLLVALFLIIVSFIKYFK